MKINVSIFISFSVCSLLINTAIASSAVGPIDATIIQRTTIEEVLSFAQNIVDFEQSNLDLLINDQGPELSQNDHEYLSLHHQIENPSALQQRLRSGNIQIYNANMESGKQMLGDIRKLQSGECSKNQVLLRLLHSRFVYLLQRASSQRESHQLIVSGSAVSYHVSTYPQFLINFHDVDYDLQIAKIQIHRYQNLNYLIKALLYLNTPEQLLPKTKHFLNVSVTLHNYLLNKTTDSGFPDYAAYELESDRHLTDLTLWAEYIDTVEIPIQFLSLGAPRQAVRVKISRADAKRDYPQYFSNTNIPALPSIPWNQIIGEEFESEVQQGQEILTPIAIAAIPDHAPAPAPAAPVTVDLQSSSINDDHQLVPVKSPSRPPSSVASASMSSPTSSPSAAAASSNIFIPRERGGQSGPLDSLNTKERNFLDSLFFGRVNKIKYRDFKSVWQKINGPRSIRTSNKGGSHFELLNCANKVVGGIFIHGEGQEYSRSYFKYLRLAFESIGINEQVLRL
ncbi:MAG: hypothetical protein HQK53_13500 [Oligoflexia bacterium]|nr:hypothetical protein [Oligoflexia bacterium]